MSTSQAPSAPRKPSTNEEPEMNAEESVPSDGKDVEGEKMMDDLGRDRKAKAGDKPTADGEPMPEQLPVS